MSHDEQGFGPCFFVLPALSLLAGLILGGAPYASAHSVWIDATPSPPPNPLNAVEFINRVDAWSVGNSGVILRYSIEDGKLAWRNFPSGSDQNLLDVTVVSEEEAWAVGVNGTILHFKDARWTPDPQSQNLTLLPLNAVTFVNPSNGWAVGGDPVRGGLILKYDGISWKSATITVSSMQAALISGTTLHDLFAIASDNVWFCGDNRRLIHFDGTSFSNETSPVADGLAWRAIDFPFRSVGWVVGDNGAIAQFSTATSPPWSEHSQSGLTLATLYDLSILPDDGRGYVVGTNGVRLHYNGASFELEITGGNDLRSVDMENELEGAAVGGSTSSGRILQLRAVTAESDVNRVRIYPNPFDPGKGRPLFFDQLPDDVSKFEIYTLLGERIAKGPGDITYDSVTGVATWPGRISGGRPAATGSYLYRIKTRSGKKRSGVFLVNRR